MVFSFNPRFIFNFNSNILNTKIGDLLDYLLKKIIFYEILEKLQVKNYYFKGKSTICSTSEN